jgi:hypothetical protein
MVVKTKEVMMVKMEMMVVAVGMVFFMSKRQQRDQHEDGDYGRYEDECSHGFLSSKWHIL